jgi:carboxyl-terminal processing protease
MNQILPTQTNEIEIQPNHNSITLNWLHFVLIFFTLLFGGLWFNTFIKKPITNSELKELIQKEAFFNLPGEEDQRISEMKGLVSSLKDPYSEYLPASSVAEFKSELNKKYEGIGVIFDFKESPKIKVISVIKNSPADSAGVKAGDLLVKVNDEDVTALASSEIINKIRGKENTTVKIDLIQDNQNISKVITRKKIEADLIQYSKEGDTGIIKIISFGEDLDDKMSKVVKEIKKDPEIKKIVLDLRGNAGGLLDESTEIVSYFLPEKTLIVQEKDKIKLSKILSKNKGDLSLEKYPLLLFVDEGSASASEIVAGALKDNRKIKLIGQKTYGKGLVQKIFTTNNGDGVKLTIAEWLTPNGTQINKKGLEVDVKIDFKTQNIIEEAKKQW